MRDMQWYDYLRVVTAIMAFVVLYGQMTRGRRLWNEMGNRARDFWWAYMMLVFVIFYGMLEAVVLNVTWGPRSILATLAIAVSLRALVLSWRSDREKGVPKVY